MNRTNPIPALAFALSFVCLPLTQGCPTTPVACASDDDCGVEARCFVADGAGACRVPLVADEPVEGAPAETAPVPPPAAAPAPEVDAPAPGALNLGRAVVTGGGRVQSGAGFSLRGSLTATTKSASTTFTALPRSIR
jgi:hypothetical protein